MYSETCLAQKVLDITLDFRMAKGFGDHNSLLYRQKGSDQMIRWSTCMRLDKYYSASFFLFRKKPQVKSWSISLSEICSVFFCSLINKLFNTVYAHIICIVSFSFSSVDIFVSN
jgi:hypothetical protein